MLRAIVTALMSIALTLPTTLTAEEEASVARISDVDREFKRALSIIHKTQLRMFRDSPADTANHLFTEMEHNAAARMATAEQALTDTHPDKTTASQTLNSRIEAMREVLADTMTSYNDAYANYITPAQLKGYRDRRRGNYVGIGLKFRSRDDDYPRVIGALLDGPLEHADVKPGDTLLKAGDQDLKGLTSRKVVNLLKGPEQSTIVITIQRADAPPHQITAVRQPVNLAYARAQLLDTDIGYIRISRFGGRTHVRVRQLLTQLEKDGAMAYILDLRHNPGGSTRAARDIVSMFSTEDVVYCERYVTGTTRNQPRHGKHVTDKPLTVLINNKSMSSSEIVAGAIQSHQRGTIIGRPSYGKGLVQQVFDLAAPLGGAIRTTIAVFGRPDHKLIHGTGIVPDIYLADDAEFMFAEEGSLNISADARRFKRQLLEQSLRTKRPAEAEKLIAATDLQLDKALNVLRDQLDQKNADNSQK